MPINVKDASGATVAVPTLADVDFATQTTLAAILARTPAAGPLTDAQLRAAPLALPTGAATDAGLAAILAALPSDPATQTTLSAILAKLITAPATEAKQDAGNASLASIAAKNFATETTLAAVLAKLPTIGQQLAAASQSVVLASDAAPLALAVQKNEDAPAGSGDPGIPLLAVRQAADTTSTDTDGDYTLLKIDEEGRLKVSSKPASYPDITGDITAVQATIGTPVAGGTVAGDVSRASNIMAFCTGTFAGVNCTFEGSLEPTGDSNWFAIQAVRSNANTIETTTGALSAQPAYAWEMSVNALKRVRVRCTARTSGTQSWRFVQGTYATEPIPASQVSATQPVSGTVAATQSGTWTVNPGNTANTTPWLTTARPATTGGLTRHRLLSAATTNATVVKASAGQVYVIHAYNSAAQARFLKLYNKATAPVPGTDTPVETYVLPPGINSRFEFTLAGNPFAAGIGYAITAALGDADTTAIAANDIVLDLHFA